MRVTWLRAALSSLLAVAICLFPGTISAHSGGTDSRGGHNCYVHPCAGTYHFHSGSPSDGGGSSGSKPGSLPLLEGDDGVDHREPSTGGVGGDRNSGSGKMGDTKSSVNQRNIALLVVGLALFALLLASRGRSPREGGDRISSRGGSVELPDEEHTHIELGEATLDMQLPEEEPTRATDLGEPPP